MTPISDNESDDFFTRRKTPSSSFKANMRMHSMPKSPLRSSSSSGRVPLHAPADNLDDTSSKRNTSTGSDMVPTISWPILLAVVPTVGSFFAGSAEAWSDFVMILLILYYVYKWMTGMYITPEKAHAETQDKKKDWCGN